MSCRMADLVNSDQMNICLTLYLRWCCSSSPSPPSLSLRATGCPFSLLILPSPLCLISFTLLLKLLLSYILLLKHLLYSTLLLQPYTQLPTNMS